LSRCVRHLHLQHTRHEQRPAHLQVWGVGCGASPCTWCMKGFNPSFCCNRHMLQASSRTGLTLICQWSSCQGWEMAVAILHPWPQRAVMNAAEWRSQLVCPNCMPKWQLHFSANTCLALAHGADTQVEEYNNFLLACATGLVEDLAILSKSNWDGKSPCSPSACPSGARCPSCS
jgi:hypothetical protein